MGSEPHELKKAIARALRDVPEVQAALLFGSHAKGTARPDSDVDIAVLLEATPPSKQRTARMRALIEALARELAADRIDLVILNDAPPKLAFRALSEGVVALERDPVALHVFVSGPIHAMPTTSPSNDFFARRPASGC